MPEITAALDADLHARLKQWADEQQRPLPALVRDILAAAERVRANYDPTMDPTVRGIRRDRDGGCGLCDAIEPLFVKAKPGEPTFNLYVLDFSATGARRAKCATNDGISLHSSGHATFASGPEMLPKSTWLRRLICAIILLK